MSPDERDDELLEEYLRGDSELSRLYRRHARERPGPELDARIRAEAQRAVSGRRRVVHGPFARHWMVPVSLAAVLVLSVSVVLLAPGPERDRDFAPELAAPPARAPSAGDRADVSQSSQARERVSADDEAAAPSDGSRLEGAGAAKRRAGEQRESAAPASEPAAAAPAVAPGPASETASRSGALPDDAVRADANAWLRFIEALDNAGSGEAARANLRAFRIRYPDHPLPPSLLPLEHSLDAERP